MVVSFILQKIRAYRMYRDTVRELSRLSDRDLHDIGISRYDIDAVARESSVG
jgi:uncharacterized protein YjiS (DUF1127 family)